MTYIQNNIGKNDEVVKVATINKLAIAPAIVWIFILLLLAGGVGLLIGLIILAVSLARVYSTHLGFSRKKIIGKSGVLSTNAIDAPLNKVDNVSVSTPMFGRVFNYSTLSINTGASIIKFNYIKDVEFFKQALLDAIDKYEKEKMKEQAEELMRMRNT